MLWPAAKMTDMVIGLDFHAVIIPPAPAPIPMVPHPYFGLIYLWMTPAFPKVNMLINGMPAMTAGAMGYSCTSRMGLPAPPSMLNLAYWRRYLTEHPEGADAGRADLAGQPRDRRHLVAVRATPDSATGRVRQGRDRRRHFELERHLGLDQGQLRGVHAVADVGEAADAADPVPGRAGLAAIGSPNVTVNGGPLAFVAPLMATSCSDLPIVPNAATVGFSNVMVGVSIADMVRALAVNAAQGAVSVAVQKGVDRATADPAEEKKSGNHPCSG